MQGDGNLVLRGIDTSGAAVFPFVTNTSYPGSTLVLMAQPPYIGVAAPTGDMAWEPGKSVEGWAGRVFHDLEVLTASPSASLTAVELAFDSLATFSAAYPWGLPTGLPAGEVASDFPATTQVLSNLADLDSIAIAPAPGYEENPYASDGAGHPSLAGGYATYQMTIFEPSTTGGPGNAEISSFTARAIVQAPARRARRS